MFYAVPSGRVVDTVYYDYCIGEMIFRQNNCTKKPHLSAEDARIFQVSISEDKPFWCYLCPICAYWHISIHGLPAELIDKFSRMVKGGHIDATFLYHKSNTKTVHEIVYENEIFKVEYSKSTKKVKVIG